MDIRKRGSTSNMVNIFVPDNSVTTGAGVTGLTKDSTNIGIAVRREKSASETTYTGANIETQTTIGTFQAPSSSAKCRLKETPNPGQYEIQFHDDAGHFGTSDASEKVYVRIYEATTTDLKIGPNTKEIQLTAFDLQLAAGSQKVDLVDAPNATAVTAIQSGLATLAKLLKYVQLLARKDAAIATDNATELTAINANGGSGSGSFNNATDSGEGLADKSVTVSGDVTLAASQPNYAPAKVADVPTAAQIAAAVLDEPATGHTGLIPTNLDAKITSVGGAGIVTLAASQPLYAPAKAADIPTADIAAIKAKTGNLPADPADQSLVIAATDSLAAAITALGSPMQAGASVTVSDKTGFALSSDGLDEVAAPLDLPSDTAARSNFVSMIRAIFNRLYNKVIQTSSQQIIHNDDNEVQSTKSASDTGTTQTLGKSA